MTISNIHQAKTHLSRLIARAVEGEEVVISKAGQPMVRLVPVERDHRPRRGGQWKGRVRIARDFDRLPPDIAAAFGLKKP